MVDKEKLGKALLHYTTAELMFLLVGVPIIIFLLPFAVATYGIVLILAMLHFIGGFIGGVAAIFFRQFKTDESYDLPQEVALILSPILITPIFSGLAGTALYALSRSEKKAEEKVSKVEEKVKEVSREEPDNE